MPLDKPLNDITVNDLLNLIVNKEAESQVIEYKKELNLKGPSDPKKDPKDEFRFDVSAFANASGGNMVIGMDEKDSFPTDLCGMDIPDPDAFKMQVDDLLRTKITPRIPSIMVRVFPLADGKAAAVIRIPRSFAKPHQVTVGKDDFQFYARNSAGKYRLDVGELRSIILQSDTLAERIRNFRLERLGNIIAGDTPVPLAEGARAILHLIPLGAFIPGTQYDIAALQQRSSELETPPLVSYRGHFNYQRPNLDGFLIVWEGNQNEEGDRSYVQVFRNGIIESVDAHYINDKHLWVQYHEVALLNGLGSSIALLNLLEVPPPIAVFVTLAGVAGYEIYVEGHRDRVYPFSKDMLLCPDILIEDYGTSTDQLLRPIFDAIWNEGGFLRCQNYDGSGKHIRSY